MRAKSANAFLSSSERLQLLLYSLSPCAAFYLKHLNCLGVADRLLQNSFNQSSFEIQFTANFKMRKSSDQPSLADHLNMHTAKLLFLKKFLGFEAEFI